MPETVADVAEHSGTRLSREALIRGWMLDAGVTGAHIAERVGMSESMVSRVIRGLSHTPRIQQAIAAAVRLPLATVFPQDAEAEKAAA